MVIIDHVAIAVVGRPSASWQCQHQTAAKEAFQPVIIETHPQTVADQPGWNGVEDVPQKESAAAGHSDQLVLEVVGAPRRQRLELEPLDLQQLAAAGIGATDDLIDKAAVFIEISKIAAARSKSAWPRARLRWPCGPSTEPFSCATPRLLRVGVMP